MNPLYRALVERVRRRPADPLVTWYGSDGARVELSGITFATAVAKTAGFLTDELDAGPGTPLRVRLPLHWQLPVWLAAAHAVGADVLLSRKPGPEAAWVAAMDPAMLSGPEPGVLVSAHPFGLPGEMPPAGVLDHARLVLGQPDVFTGAAATGRIEVPGGWLDTTDISGRGRALATGARLSQGGRLLVADGTEPVSDAGVALGVWAVPLLVDGSVVLVQAGDADQIAATESVTARFRVDGGRV